MVRYRRRSSHCGGGIRATLPLYRTPATFRLNGPGFSKTNNIPYTGSRPARASFVERIVYLSAPGVGNSGRLVWKIDTSRRKIKKTPTKTNSRKAIKVTQ